MPHQLFPSAGAALKSLLARHKPAVVGFGEFHQTHKTTRIRSATRRFTEALVPLLAGQATDLVVETWVTAGKCGKHERKVVRQVEQVTERPQATEDEVVTLLKRAKGLGIRPHILRVSCKDYQRLLSGGGKVDYQQLLGLVTRALQDKAQKVLAAGRRRGLKLVVAVYGGALHNDLYPYDELKQFSYAAALRRAVGGRYLELDLYVPEFVQRDETLKTERWYPLMTRLASKKQVLLIQRGKGSYILVLRRGVGG